MSENGKAVERPKRASTGLYVKAAPGLRLRDRKVTRLAMRVRAALPWLTSADAPCLRAWCEFEFLAGQVYAALRALGVLNKAQEARRLLDDYRHLRLAQVVLARELGLTPAARQALKVGSDGMAFDLAEQVTTRAVAISEQRGAPPDSQASDDDEVEVDDGREAPEIN
jgi:hypothetical protein